MKPTLRLSAAPRSVSDATRFTATTLHASSKAAAPPPRFAPPKSGPRNTAPGGTGGGDKDGPIHETPEQKVARLRAAHLRAKAAQTSRFDRIIEAGSRVFDSAHKITVVGLIGFTGNQSISSLSPLSRETCSLATLARVTDHLNQSLPASQPPTPRSTC